MEGQWHVRTRAFLDSNLSLVLVSVLLVAAVGGYLTVGAYAGTETRTERVQVASWESRATFQHSATVVNDTAVYDRGTTLRDRRTYFRNLTPRLDGSFRYTYTASDSGDVRANASTVLVMRSIEETEEGNATEYWRLESELGRGTADSLSPGETVTVPFSVNVSAAAQRLDAIDEQFGSTPGQKELLVESRLRLSGTRNGQPIETTRTYQLPISPSGGVYEVGDSGPVTHSGEQTEPRTVTVEPGPLEAYGGPVLLLGALAVVAGLAVASNRGALTVSESERTWLRYRSARSEFDDWITVARVPDDVPSSQTVEVDTLEGLVDVAIDTDQRVLEDRDRDRFLVFDADRTYVHTPPSPPAGEDTLLD